MAARALTYWRSLSPQTRQLAAGLLTGAGLLLCCAVIANTLDTVLDVRMPSMTFLCPVILVALWFGRRPALITAIFSFLAYNFYLTEPRYTLRFAGWEDVLTLSIFIGVALLIGNMAGTLHDQRERAEEQARIFSSLFSVSRTMAEGSDADRALQLLAAGATQVAARAAVVYRRQADGSTTLLHTLPSDVDPPSQVRSVADALIDGEAGQLDAKLFEATGWRLLPLTIGGKRVAVLAWQPGAYARSDEHAIAVRLLAELTCAAIERTQYLHRQVEIDSLAATERLRTALMSSISHDFRTPLSTILTSASSLLTYGEQFSGATRADLLTSIQEEAERLNRFIGNILDMTRLDAGVVQPREEWLDPLDVLERLEARARRSLAISALSVSAPAAVPAVFGDALLLEQAMFNALENAVRHTPAGSALRIGADNTAERVRLWVEDDGPGVPATDLTNIFDKFYRLGATHNSQGAGLGLAISKGFVDAMHGEIKAVSPAANGRGLRIEFVFPLQAALAHA